jgi:hypothetical protein
MPPFDQIRVSNIVVCRFLVELRQYNANTGDSSTVATFQKAPVPIGSFHAAFRGMGQSIVEEFGEYECARDDEYLPW